MTNTLLDTIPAPAPPSDLDELMMRDPNDLSAQDIDAIVAMQRQHRARLASGTKTKRAKPNEAPSIPIDLAALGLIADTPAPKPAMPTGGGTRR